MLYVSSIENINNYKVDECWVIVRSLKYSIRNTKHVPELSPPKDLFYDYLNWSKAGQWNRYKFDNEYVPRFIEYLHTNEQAKNKLNELFNLCKTKDILIVCFCVDERVCHRSIIAGLLQSKGIKVHSKYQTLYNW